MKLSRTLRVILLASFFFVSKPAEAVLPDFFETMATNITFFASVFIALPYVAIFAQNDRDLDDLD